MVRSWSNGSGTKAVYCFLSDLLGKKVYAGDGGFMGRVADLIAAANGGHPEIKGLIIARGGLKRFLTAQSIDLAGLAGLMSLTVAEDELTEAIPGDQHFLVRDTLYDKQIVDMNGAKVERVNDVRIVFCAKGVPRLDSVDVGFTGLVRRLGWEGRVRRLVRWCVGLQLKDELIAWRFVQPLPEQSRGPIHLSLRHEQIRHLHAGELADIIEELDRDERITLVQSISTEDAADALEEADIDVQTSILRDLDTEVAADILEEMEPAAAVDVIDNLPVEEQQTIMAAMEEEDRARLEPLFRAGEDTAASLMTVDYLSCPEDYSTAQAFELVRANAREVESITYIFCVDEKSSLTGVVSLRNLLLAQPYTALSQIMNRRLATLNADDDWETVASEFLKYRFKALPVVDEEGRIQGIVTFKHSFVELLSYYSKLAA